jgi:phthalate 4,5-dioxygenase reductase subunit
MDPTSGWMKLQITEKRLIAKGTYWFVLKHPEGAALPQFEAGAHVTLKMPNGLNRQYSLCGDPENTRRYEFAVKRESAGRGGSLSLADDTKVGDWMEVSLPIHAFGLDPKAKSFLLIAGGIGITPMRSMLIQLQSESMRKFKLIYLTRDAESTAFLDELTSDAWTGHVQLHHDQGDAKQAFDLWKLLEKPVAACHVYCCGPKRLMDEVKDMTGHWPTSAVHFESFGAGDPVQKDDREFTVGLAKTGKTVRVGAGQSLLDALRGESVLVPSSCESGTCGSCKVTLLEGEADHRDCVLMDDEKSQHIMVCVSRAFSEHLVLDL